MSDELDHSYLYIISCGLLCKIGLSDNPHERFKPYWTLNKYYKPDIIIKVKKGQEIETEKRWLSATVMYNDFSDNNLTHEGRYGVTGLQLWDLCRPFCPEGYEIVTLDQIPKIERPDRYNDHGSHLKFSSLLELKNFNTDNKIFELRGYQKWAFPKMVEMFESGIRDIVLNILCRCGKTVLFGKFAQKYQDLFDTIIYLGPRIALISNIKETLKHFTKKQMIEIHSQSPDGDLFAIECFMYGQLDPGIKKQTKFNKFLLTCNDSAFKLDKLFKVLNPGANVLIIMDEAHNLCQSIDNEKPNMLRQFKQAEENYKINITRISATATPIIGTMKDLCEDKAIFMNDPKWFGPYENWIRFSNIEEAIKDGFMCPAKMIFATLDSKLPTFKELDDGGNISIQMLRKLLESKNEEIGVEVRPRKFLLYTSSISKAEIIKKFIETCGLTCFQNAEIFMVHSKLPKADIELNNFTNNITREGKVDEQKLFIMINCRMLSEGINIADLDGVLFVDPRYGACDIQQINCRPRSSNPKNPRKIAFVMIPVFTNKGGKFTNFQTILSVLQDLRNNQDLSVIKLIKSINEPRDKKERGSILIDGIEFDMDENIKLQIIDEMQTKLYMHTSLVTAIKSVLTENYIAMPKSLIINSIINYGLLTKEFVLSCSFEEACRKDSSILYNSEHKLYYVKQEQKISTEEFIDQLRERSILNSIDYASYFGGRYDSIFVINPEKIYVNFKFELLNNQIYYSFDQCKELLISILSDQKHKYNLEGYITRSEKMIYLNKIDQMIPIDTITIYGAKRSSELELLL